MEKGENKSENRGRRSTKKEESLKRKTQKEEKTEKAKNIEEKLNGKLQQGQRNFQNEKQLKTMYLFKLKLIKSIETMKSPIVIDDNLSYCSHMQSLATYK